MGPGYQPGAGACLMHHDDVRARDNLNSTNQDKPESTLAEELRKNLEEVLAVLAVLAPRPPPPWTQTPSLSTGT